MGNSGLAWDALPWSAVAWVRMCAISSSGEPNVFAQIPLGPSTQLHMCLPEPETPMRLWREEEPVGGGGIECPAASIDCW